MRLVDRVRVRLRDQPEDLVPATLRLSRFAARRLRYEGINRYALRRGGYWEHFGVHNPRNNAGDTVLFETIENLFDHALGAKLWHKGQLRELVSSEDVLRLNRDAEAVLVGGGGLLISDSNPNVQSGWQWRIGLEELRALKTPLVIFAIGYNQFRGSEGFPDVFDEHLALTIEKSVFFGLRNRGSIRRTQSHLAPDLHNKLRWQPCMTTVMRHFHPLASPREQGAKRIAVNLAFDRAEKRFGGDFERIKSGIVKAMRWAVDHGWKLVLTLHAWDDDPAVTVFREQNIPADVVRLNLHSASQVIDFYARMPLTIGMRGHAQMIPFGCGNAIMSLISHDKLGFFLEDIGHPEWGVDVRETNIAEAIVDRIKAFEAHRDETFQQVDDCQAQLWKVTQENLQEIRQRLAR